MTRPAMLFRKVGCRRPRSAAGCAAQIWAGRSAAAPCPHKGDEGQHHADEHTQRCAESRRPQSQVQHAQKHELEGHAQHRHQDVDAHAAADVARDAQVVVHGVEDGGERGEHGVGAQVLHRQGGEFALGTHHPDQEGGRREHGRAHHHARGKDQDAGAGEYVVGLFAVPAAQGHRDGHRRAHAHQVRQGKVDDDKGHGEVEGGKGRAVQKVAHQNAVDQLVKGGGQHTDSPRQRRREEQLQRRCLGKKRGRIHTVYDRLLSAIRTRPRAPGSPHKRPQARQKAPGHCKHNNRAHSSPYPADPGAKAPWRIAIRGPPVRHSCFFSTSLVQGLLYQKMGKSQGARRGRNLAFWAVVCYSIRDARLAPNFREG